MMDHESNSMHDAIKKRKESVSKDIYPPFADHLHNDKNDKFENVAQQGMPKNPDKHMEPNSEINTDHSDRAPSGYREAKGNESHISEELKQAIHNPNYKDADAGKKFGEGQGAAARSNMNSGVKNQTQQVSGFEIGNGIQKRSNINEEDITHPGMDDMSDHEREYLSKKESPRSLGDRVKMSLMKK